MKRNHNMKNNEEEITKEDYKPKLLKRMIILCWIVLGLCFIVKLFGGNFFNIVCQDERFINFCNYVQNSFWYYVVSFITSAITHYFIWSIMFDVSKFNKKQSIALSIIFIVTFIIQSIMNYYNLSNYIILMSVIRYIIVPFVFKCNWKRILIVNVLDIIFQLIAMVTKNVNIMGFDDNVLVALIFMIDYYIMLILTWLYNNKIRIRRENMGMFGGWFLHKPLAELEALLPTLKDEKEINACKKRIEKLKAKDEKKKSN